MKDNYDYYAFGEALDQSISTGQSYRYTGKPFDNDRGLNLHYYGTRYYDGTTGRFDSVDPLASKYPSVSPYVYTLNSPMRFTDPDGREIVVRDPAERAYFTKLINSRARGTFRFDEKGTLQVVTTKGKESYSEYYRDRLIEAINDQNHTITLNTGAKLTANGTTHDVDAAGGGITASNGEGTDQTVVISGHENKGVKDTNGNPLPTTAADVLVHELVGHAIPCTVGSDTGDAVDNENKVREQVKDHRQRAPEKEEECKP